MKKFLPKNTTYQGFTLIELLVVIAIIAVLAIMGFAAFGGLSAKGNDDRRAADMKADADAMEVVRARTSASVYSAPALTDFATGAAPKEPVTTRTQKYCYKDSTSAAVGNPASSDWGTLACPSGWASVDGSLPSVTGSATYFKFCTVNDAVAAVICQGSRQ